MTRDAGVDLARGLAVCTMVVAHTSPSRIDLPTEYLTAPLFATLVGVGLALAWERRRTSVVGFAGENLWRGFVLIVLGVLLQRSYPFIDVVLQTLGVLTIVLAPLVAAVGRRPWVALGGAAVMALASPVIMTASRQWLAGQLGPSPIVVDAVEWLAAGANYRTTSDLAFGLVGVALATWLVRARDRVSPLLRRAPWVVAGLVALTLLAYGGGHLAGMNTHAYSGSFAEIVGSSAYAAGALIACCWLTWAISASTRALAALIATGRLALTAYALQILLLAGLFCASGPSFNDNNWGILGGLIIAIVAGCWAWATWVRRPGPLEAVLRLPRLLPTVVGTRANAEK
ncbi:MAG: DUF418 domain-containing protein [Tetrasphaera sp.]